MLVELFVGFYEVGVVGVGNWDCDVVWSCGFVIFLVGIVGCVGGC